MTALIFKGVKMQIDISVSDSGEKFKGKMHNISAKLILKDGETIIFEQTFSEKHKDIYTIKDTMEKIRVQIKAVIKKLAAGWMEVGTGSGQGAASTTLATYIVGSRTALDSKTRGANAIITMVCTFAAGVGTGAITEAGIFNIVTQNTTDLITYADFSVINKAAADSMIVTWTLTFA